MPTVHALTTLKRLPDRGSHDRSVIDPILDQAKIAHVGFLRQGHPAVVPTLFVRVGDDVVIHGAPASALLRHAKSGHPICLETTIVDGIVLARSGFHHSINYRSVVVYGAGRPVTGQAKIDALDALVDKLAPGRSAVLRPMTRNEVAGTTVIALPLDSATAKTRSGPPVDEPEDYALPVWAGVVPVHASTGKPQPDELMDSAIPVPSHVAELQW